MVEIPDIQKPSKNVGLSKCRWSSNLHFLIKNVVSNSTKPGTKSTPNPEVIN